MTDAMDGQTDPDRLFTRRVTIIAALALGLIAIAPFLSNTGLTYSWSYLKLLALQTAVLITWTGLLMVQPVRVKDLFRASGVGLPVALILVWGVLSRLWSSAPWAAVQPLLELTVMGLAVVGLANLFTRRQVRQWFTVAYGCFAALACLAYIPSKLEAEGEARMTVYPFDNPNLAAAFAILPMTVGASYAIAACLGRARSGAGILGGIVAVVCGIAILVSESAAALIAGIGALALVGVFACRPKTRKRVLIALAALAVAGSLLVVFVLGDTPWFAAHLGSRPALWKGGVALVAKAPVQGLGLGSFPVEYTSVYPLEYAAHELWSAVVLKAHSLPLHVAAELGIVGLALAALLIFFVARRARVAARRARRGERILVYGLVCGCLGMLAQGLVGMPLHYIEGYVNLVLAVALIGGLSGRRTGGLELPAATSAPPMPPTPPGDESPNLIRYAGPLLLLVLYLFTAWPGLLAQNRLREGIHVPRADLHRAVERIELLEGAVSVGWPTLWTVTARHELANTSWEWAQFLDRERSRRHLAKQAFEAALEHVQAIDRLAPNFGNCRKKEAMIQLKLARDGDDARGGDRIEAATRAIIDYCRKDPFDIEAYQTWQDILTSAQHRGRPGIAQPKEAARLLEIAEKFDCKRLPKADIQKMKPLFQRAARELKP